MEEEKLMSFFRFEDLRIYDKVLAYVEWVYGTANLFPEIESTGGLASRFFNASQNIAVYIAEGSGRNKMQFVSRLKEARASVRECLVLSTIANKLGFITEDKNNENREMLIEISKMLGALITSLQKPGNRRQDPKVEVEEEKLND